MSGWKENSGALLIAASLALAASTAHATAVAVGGGGGSSWFVSDEITTTNGLPTGGSFTNTGSGSGFTISDASIPGQGDAFDFASMVWVDNTQYGSPLSVSGQTVSGGTVAISGLDVRMSYFFDPTAPIARVLVELTNAGEAAVGAHVDWASNVGADAGFQITGSSSGDTAFTAADRWVASDDGNLGGGDPALVFALYGTGAAVTAGSTGTTVFGAAGTQGILAGFDLAVGAGETRSLMFFHEMNATTTGALAATGRYDGLAAGDSALAGLSSAQLAQVANWSFAAVPEPGTLGALALGLAALALRRRRARR